MPHGRTFPRALCAAVVITVALAPAAYAATPAPAADTAGPALVAATVTPAQADVGTAPAVVAVAVRLTDESGVATASLALGSGVVTPLSRTAGGAGDGTWSGVVTVPAFTPFGPLAAHVATTDALGNAATPTVDGAFAVLDAAPAAPAQAAAYALADGTLRVDWSAPPVNGGSPVDGYTVTAVPVGAAAVPPVLSPDGAARTATLTGLTAATRYVVRVAAHNLAGTGPAAITDAATGPVDVTVPDAPTAPTALAVTPGNGSLDVAWTVPASDGGSPVTAYDVRATPRSTGVPVVAGVTGPTAVLSGLANGETYDVTVTAANAVGPSLPAAASGTPRTVPGRPVAGNVTAGDATALVRWSPPVDDGGAPVLSYTVTAVPSGRVVTVPAGARAVNVTPLANGLPTTFTVTAVNAAGSGAASAPGVVVVPRALSRLVVAAQPAPAIRYGTVTTVVASLVTLNGLGVPWQPVELMAQVRPSTTWRRVATGTTGTDGRVRLQATFPANTALKLHHPAGAFAAPDAAVRSISVAPRLTATVEAARIRLGANVVVRGDVAPAQPVGAAIQLQRYVNGAWRAVAAGRMNTPTRYGVSWRPATAGGYTLRVVKPAGPVHALGGTAQWRQTVVPETVADVARAILADRSIIEETTHESGVRDAATARQNILDLAAGRLSRRSSYQNAPGGSTSVDIRLLRALRLMGLRGSVTVSEITGGSHAVGSTHYSGHGLDINVVNGSHVGPGSGYAMAVDACRANGASRVFNPGYDPYGGHSNHVHCEWT